MSDNEYEPPTLTDEVSQLEEEEQRVIDALIKMGDHRDHLIQILRHQTNRPDTYQYHMSDKSDNSLAVPMIVITIHYHDDHPDLLFARLSD